MDINLIESVGYQIGNSSSLVAIYPMSLADFYGIKEVDRPWLNQSNAFYGPGTAKPSYLLELGDEFEDS
jgi:hypothetical protein